MATVMKRYDVCAGRPYTTRNGENKKHWINIGRAAEWDDGGISIEMHAIPVGNWFDGKLTLYEQKPRDESNSGRRQAPAQRSEPAPLDDDIPF